MDQMCSKLAPKIPCRNISLRIFGSTYIYLYIYFPILLETVGFKVIDTGRRRRKCSSNCRWENIDGMTSEKLKIDYLCIF
jgi:hypothetical protein